MAARVNFKSTAVQTHGERATEWVSEWMINVSRLNANHIKRTNSHFYLFICRNETSIFQVSKCFLRRAAREMWLFWAKCYMIEDTIPFSLSWQLAAHHITSLLPITPHLQWARVHTLRRFVRLFNGLCACTDVVATNENPTNNIFSTMDGDGERMHTRARSQNSRKLMKKN